MANYWNIPGVPHRGWSLDDVIDIRGEDQAEWETDYESCMMCGNEKIRYVHIVSHSEVNEEFRVGCVCAEKMTDDYVNPKDRQRQLENRAKRKENWKYKDWKQSQKGNDYFKFEEHLLVIFRDKKTNKFKYTIDGNFGLKSYQYLSEAKEAIFNTVEEMRENGDW